jgi:apolipoprotein D and lipocalin family protein
MIRCLALFGLGAGLIALLSACTGVPKGVTPVTGFDSERYLGKWYEIARLDHSFERGLSHVTADYATRDDGRISVLNKGYNEKKGKWEDAGGVAKFQGDESTASLSVTFQWPFSGGYHVIALDKESYQWAMVSGPSKGYLWILAREPQLDETKFAELVAQARGLGFPVDELIKVKHHPPPGE